MRKYYLNNRPDAAGPKIEPLPHSPPTDSNNTPLDGTLLGGMDERAVELMEAIGKYLGRDEYNRIKTLISGGSNLHEIRNQMSEPFERTFKELEFLSKMTGSKALDFDNALSGYRAAMQQANSLKDSMGNGPMGLLGALSGNPMLPMLANLSKGGLGGGDKGMDVNSLLPILASMSGNVNTEMLGNIFSAFASNRGE